MPGDDGHRVAAPGRPQATRERQPPVECLAHRHDIWAIERDEIVGPRIDVFYTEHLYCGEDDLFGSGHPPETVVAMALAYHAFTTGRWPSDETPARAPAGGTR